MELITDGKRILMSRHQRERTKFLGGSIRAQVLCSGSGGPWATSIRFQRNKDYP